MASFSLSQAASQFSLKSSTLTPSSCAVILATFPSPSSWSDRREYELVAKGVSDSLAALDGLLPCIAAPASPRLDGRSRPEGAGPRTAAAEGKVKIHTDYPYLVELVSEWSSRAAPPAIDVEFVEDPSDADVFWHVTQVKSFLSLPLSTLINQFPYEGGFVRKDLLGLTVRRYCYGSPGLPSSAPRWWQPYYDLRTEFHLLAADFDARAASGDLDNRWVVKPGQGTRSDGVFVASDMSSLAKYISAPERAAGDFVAQLIVPRPLTVFSGRKFDLRVFVFVRSFVPFEAYVHSLIYARVSNKAYDASLLSDDEVFLTVTSYKEGIKEGARLTIDKLAPIADADAPGIDFMTVVPEIHTALGELFGGIAPSIGAWPSSRAYYGCDVIVGRDLVPKLLEVNYQADFYAPKTAVTQNQDNLDMYYQWGEDLLTTLATDVDLSSHPRLTRLEGK